jgi:hypothetical protein
MFCCAQLSLVLFGLASAKAGGPAPTPKAPPWAAEKILPHKQKSPFPDDTRRCSDLTATTSKRERKGRGYVDYLRNAIGSTAIAPYSTRAPLGAGISMPVDWEELELIWEQIISPWVTPPSGCRICAGLSRAGGSIALPMRRSTTLQRGLGHSQHGTFPIAAATLASLQG